MLLINQELVRYAVNRIHSDQVDIFYILSLESNEFSIMCECNRNVYFGMQLTISKLNTFIIGVFG